MAGLNFSLGGKLDPSFRASLNQAVAESQAAGMRIQNSLRKQISGLDKQLSSASPGSAEALAAETKRSSLSKALLIAQNGQFLAAAKQRIAMREAEAVAAKAAAAKIAAAAATSIHFNGGAFNEILVVLREIGRGNWQKVPGSISIALQKSGFDLLKVFTSIPGVVAIAGAAIAYFTTKHIKELNEALDKTSELLEGSIGDRAAANYSALKEATDAAAEFTAWLIKLGRANETLADKTDAAIASMREQFELMRQISGADNSEGRAAEQAERRKELDFTNHSLQQQKEAAANSKSGAKSAEAAAYGSPEATTRIQKLKSLPAEMADAAEGVKKFTAIQKDLAAQVEAKRAPILEQLTREVLASRGTSQEGYARRQLELAGNYGNNQELTAKSGERMSLDTATSELSKYTNLVKSQQKLQIELEGVQRQLTDALREAKDKAQSDNSAVEKLSKERDKLSEAIQLHARLDPILAADQKFQESLAGKPTETQRAMIAAEIERHKKNADYYLSVGDSSADISAAGENAEVGKLQKQLAALTDSNGSPGSLGRGLRADLTERERVGFGSPQIALLDVNRSMDRKLGAIQEILKQRPAVGRNGGPVIPHGFGDAAGGW